MNLFEQILGSLLWRNDLLQERRLSRFVFHTSILRRGTLLPACLHQELQGTKYLALWK